MLGFISDLHFDINKIDDETAVNVLISVIKRHDLDVLVLVGDTYNDFTRTQQLVQEISDRHDNVQVFFVAGNHDMGRNVSAAELEETYPHYLHKRYVDLPNSNIRLIGHNGWYDYSLSPTVSEEAGWAFHNGLYFDRVIPQNESDLARTDKGLDEMAKLLQQAQADQKEVIFATHFVPIKDDLHVSEDLRLQLVNAMMGSKRVGELLQAQKNVRAVVFGHQHVNPPIRYYDDVPYVNVALGIKKRHQEWLNIDLMTAIEEKCTFFEITLTLWLKVCIVLLC
ncbi:metallophosphoesterase [Weissella ceti]|uniref:Putative phosphohydrolase n=1 Tax=Weissella ceti TaxID=759620 RepID=A0A088GHQ0_9LACO|nr:metallophosphoesterase [Weissella ceti]AIM63506.1 putative phosphohydrolase [Weissella ceti]